MNILGVILARGGSKRVPGKNLRFLGGHPLVAWTIMAAKGSMMLKEIVVSSDSQEILGIARQYGAEPLLRPKEMATDEASSYPALLHAVDSRNLAPDWICLLQPTSPFRYAVDIDVCIVMTAHSGMPACISVNEGKTVPNGAIYVGNIGWLRDSLARGIEHPFDSCVLKYFMPPDRGLDIDTEEDFTLAESMME